MAVTTVDKSRTPLARARDAVWNPTTASLRLLALGGVVANAGIIFTGGAVRLSASGLGCPTWPKCTGDSLIPTAHPGHSPLNMAIEFGNRMLTFAVLAVAIAVFVAARRLRPQRPELVVLAALQPVGVLLQAGLGGVTVLTKLHPATVSAHYLLSSGMIFVAFLLWVRVGEGDGPAHRIVTPAIRWTTTALVWATIAVLAAGTVVTGSGPHAGDAQAQRFPFEIETVARIHGLTAWLTVALALALAFLMHRTQTPTRPRQAVHILLAALVAQGAIGYLQYYLEVPAVLVGIHLLGSALLWIAVLNVLYTQRIRPDAPQKA
ncbi:COX15/CtaA family protein [Actinocorallia sp. A-T 12471]|uniref:COX15/CtaA family protein n=1 Tax=Actinocorallia sp. A-T 12471 TaxID=3089813 RepID=UPI0029CDD020|nr:COX15/CtaA family protein [Actinocorallia sp. A-T 12471]MDX6740558.1 COX15/CtaA family protein [Actinocorallia sp. A-T 12471]